MTYYKSSRRSHTPISDAAMFFSNQDNYDRVFRSENPKKKQVKNQSLEKVKEIFDK